MERVAHQIAYEKWLSDFKDDQALVDELALIAQDEDEIKDRFYTDLQFGTAGMRGKIAMGANRMNEYTVRRATQGFAAYIKRAMASPAEEDRQKETAVVIAYDSRRNSRLFAEQAALVLCQNDIRAYLFDELTPVPVLSFAVRYMNALAGIVITASHNPKQDNGYKVYWSDGAQLPPGPAAEVQGLIRSFDYADCALMDRAEAERAGLLKSVEPRVLDAYIAHVKSLCINPSRFAEAGESFKVVYSPLHGSGYKPVCRVLTEMGVVPIVVASQADPDPDFGILSEPNPEKSETLRMAIDLARSEDADICFATDPDCDRLGAAARDPKTGDFVLLNGNQIGCLLLHYLLSEKQQNGTLPSDGVVVKSIVTTNLSRKIAAHYGQRLVEKLTGFKFIAEVVKGLEKEKNGAFLFGFEESYGFLSSSYVRDKDAVNASLLLTELALSLHLKGQTLHDRLQEIYDRFGYFAERNVSIAYPGERGKQQMDAIMARLRRPENRPRGFSGIPVVAWRDYTTGKRLILRGEAFYEEALCEEERTDMLYYELENEHWLCVRPSGTEAKIKIYVGAYGQNAAAIEKAERLADAILEDMRKRVT